MKGSNSWTVRSWPEPKIKNWMLNQLSHSGTPKITSFLQMRILFLSQRPLHLLILFPVLFHWLRIQIQFWIKLVVCRHSYLVPHFRDTFSPRDILEIYFLNLFSDSVYQTKVQSYSFLLREHLNISECGNFRCLFCIYQKTIYIHLNKGFNGIIYIYTFF